MPARSAEKPDSVPARGSAGGRLYRIFDTLYSAYGPQEWWPGDTPFEIMVGAVLTQNTAWSNVERAIASLTGAGALDARELLKLPEKTVARLIRSAGYFNVKAGRLRNLCHWYIEQGEYAGLAGLDTEALRRGLLSVNGVGPETADDILLYAFGRPVFVIDAYTRRIFSRLDIIRADKGYEELRHFFENGLVVDGVEWTGAATQQAQQGGIAGVFNEYHALIVAHGKETCRPKPLCERCPLVKDCSFLPE